MLASITILSVNITTGRLAIDAPSNQNLNKTNERVQQRNWLSECQKSPQQYLCQIWRKNIISTIIESTRILLSISVMPHYMRKFLLFYRWSYCCALFAGVSAEKCPFVCVRLEKVIITIGYRDHCHLLRVYYYVELPFEYTYALFIGHILKIIICGWVFIALPAHRLIQYNY